MKKASPDTLASNRKAFADFEILEKIEAGIVLTGPEVKSVRASQANLKGSYVEISNKGEAWVKNLHISPYKHAQQKEYNPTKKRKLLLNKKEITKIDQNISEQGITVIPLDFHISKNRIKLTIGICKGKKKYDRRDELKKRAQKLDIERALKKY